MPDSWSDVSVSTTVKNRLQFLKQTLPNWLLTPFKNIYVLNWNSDDTQELHEFVESLHDGRIVVEDIIGKRTTYFIASISRNIAAERCLELTMPKYLFQVDSDVLLISAELKKVKLYDDTLYFSECVKEVCQPGWADKEWDEKKYSADAATAQRNRLKYGTFGTCLMPADKVWKYGHYNENFIENCLFDCYYISKYVENEPENIWFLKHELHHIDHSNDDRVKETPEHDFVRGTAINKALSALPPYRYPYTIREQGKLEIN